RRHLAQLEHRRTRKTVPDRLRPLTRISHQRSRRSGQQRAALALAADGVRGGTAFLAALTTD
ncbi:hypothetical protein ACFWY5_44840, partial [Nonomuraea sp. NPDC059007]|uniref:hypothetical protein n=1 Tax=Nonomuraea sp. NPDC059007 TaxID=3346692 RepID=UPI0036A48F1D